MSESEVKKGGDSMIGGLLFCALMCLWLFFFWLIVSGLRELLGYKRNQVSSCGTSVSIHVENSFNGLSW